MPATPFRERTAAQLRQQVEAYRSEAESAPETDAKRLRHLAERYAELGQLKDESAGVEGIE